MINQVIYRVIAQECDQIPTRSFDEVWASSRDRLVGMGLSPDIVDEVDVNRDVQQCFAQRLVPNPLYWRRHFDRRFCFYLTRAKSSRYQYLLDSLRSELPDVSFFVCYSEFDAIVRLLGNEDTIRQTEELLTALGFPPAVMRVQEVPFFYDRRVKLDPNSEEPELAPSQIDAALSSPVASTDPRVVKELLETGIALGSIYFEDVHKTGRILAFMGVKFDTLLQATQRKRFEEALLGLNRDQVRLRNSLPLSSIYRCGVHFDYFLEMIFDDQQQLDSITDAVQELHPNVDDTVTFILAKRRLAPIQFSRVTQERTERFTALRAVLDQQITPLAETLLDERSPELEAAFAAASTEQRFQALSLFRDLLVPRIHSATIEAFPTIEEHVTILLGGVLQKNGTSIKNAGLGFIRDVVEREHLKLARSIVENCFDGDSGLLQKALKADNAQWERWGLAKWAQYIYPRWNRHSLYGAVLEIPRDILQSLRLVGETRNRVAHNSDVGDIERLEWQVREAFLHGYRVLAWIPSAVEALEAPAIPLNVAQSIALSGPGSTQFELLTTMRRTQVEMADLLTLMESQSQERWTVMASDIRGIASGIRELDDDMLDRIEELILPVMQDREETRAQQLIAYLRETARALPSEVVVTLLSGLITRAVGAP